MTGNGATTSLLARGGRRGARAHGGECRGGRRERQASARLPPPDGAPMIRNYEWKSDGTLSGYVYGKPGARRRCHHHERSGPAQRLTLMWSPSPARRTSSARRRGRTCAVRTARRHGQGLAARRFAELGEQTVEGMEELSCGRGRRPRRGGAAAEKVLKAAFAMLDENVLRLRVGYATARRVVLRRNGAPVAAAVGALAHAEHFAILDVADPGLGARQRHAATARCWWRCCSRWRRDCPTEALVARRPARRCAVHLHYHGLQHSARSLANRARCAASSDGHVGPDLAASPTRL